MIVTLTWDEICMGAVAGSLRQSAAIRRNSKNLYGAIPSDCWSLHAEGACGEIAVAKALNLFWGPGVDSFKDRADVGGRFDVRTRLNHDRKLIVRRDDPDDRIIVSVTGKAPRFDLRGWLYAREAKQERWLTQYGELAPAYFVPQKELRPMRELFDLLASEAA